MAKILLCEPSPEIRLLLERVVARLGHEAVVELPADGGVAAVVLEPASAACVEGALALREARPDLPVICVSMLTPSRETAALQPHAHVMKPFALADVERAVLSALQVGDMDAAVRR